MSKTWATNAQLITWGRPSSGVTLTVVYVYSVTQRKAPASTYPVWRSVWCHSKDLTNLTNNHKTNKSWNVTFPRQRWLKGLWRVLREAYVGANTSERDILRKTTELQLQLISHLPLKKRTRKRGRGDPRPPLLLRPSRGDCYPSLVSTLRHQSLPFRGGETGWGHALQDSRVVVLMPSPHLLPGLTTPHTQLRQLLRAQPRPEGPRTAETAASPQPPTTPPPPTTLIPGYVFHPSSIVVTFYLSQSPSGCT